ncbi:MAG: phenylacetate--CoA ligase [Gammaproteobacteria bacterium]|nr:phenylacetate--CoA ligase [Gammaproteobacteria bacterium]
MILHQVETLPREDLEKLQLRRLKNSVERCYANVPHYRQAMDALGFRPHQLQSLADLVHLPFTSKSDLRDNYPFGLFAVPSEQVVRIHASSGTTGKPTVVGYTRRDIDTWSDLMARTLSAAGLGAGDRFHNAYGYGLFTGGLGFHYGAERLGCTVIPMSGGQTRKQLMLLQDFAPTGLGCTPSYALNIAEEASREAVDVRKLPLRVGVFGAEPWTEAMRQEIESRLGIQAIDIYGLSEIIGPGVSVECIEAKHGLHIWEDHFLVEVVNPDSGEPLPYGEEGELVFTSLTKEALPIIRYRTRDLSVLDPTPCRCGRTHVRMRRITGRTDDMLIIRGVNVFPSQIEAVLVEDAELSPFYQIEVFREGSMDSMMVNVEATPALVQRGAEAMVKVGKKAEKAIKDLVGVTCPVVVKGIDAVPRSQGKAVRVIDHRNR